LQVPWAKLDPTGNPLQEGSARRYLFRSAGLLLFAIQPPQFRKLRA